MTLATTQSSDLTKTKRFTEAELGCEYYRQQVAAGNAWDKCYPWHDENSDRWPAYEIEAEREQTLLRFIMTDSFDTSND